MDHHQGSIRQNYRRSMEVRLAPGLAAANDDASRQQAPTHGQAQVGVRPIPSAAVCVNHCCVRSQAQCEHCTAPRQRCGGEARLPSIAVPASFCTPCRVLAPSLRPQSHRILVLCRRLSSNIIVINSHSGTSRFTCCGARRDGDVGGAVAP